MQTIHHLEELMAALHAGVHELRTPPNALNYLGVGYVAAMIAEAKKERPDFILWCDAGTNAGAVMEGLQCGLTHITVDVGEEALTKLQQMAKQRGAAVQKA